MEVTTSVEMLSEEIEIHRLFYVDHNNSLYEEVHRIATDSQIMSKIILVLDQVNVDKNQVFGIFGDKSAVKTHLYSLFPNNHGHVDSMFVTVDPMPAIWVVYDNVKFVFLLISTYDTSSEKAYNFTVVMQRYLHDICQNVLICPSKDFFSNFSTEHSFHGKSYATVTYLQAKQEESVIQRPEEVALDDKNILKTLLIQNSGHILTTNNTSTSYCLQKSFQKETSIDLENKLNKLKESLKSSLNLGSVTLGGALKACQQCGIFVSQSQMENILSEYTKDYNEVKVEAHDKSRVLIKDLLGISHYSVVRWLKSDNSTANGIKHQLYDILTDWLINPVYIDQDIQQISHKLNSTLKNYKQSKNVNIDIKSENFNNFLSKLPACDRKDKICSLQKKLIQNIHLAIKSENQSEVHYNIQQFCYNPANDTENRLQCLTVMHSTLIKISLNNLGRFLNVSDLSESDRLTFSTNLEFFNCFKMSDGKTDIITIKRPSIKDKKIGNEKGYTVLVHKNGGIGRVTDLHLSEVCFSFSFNQKSHTLVAYNLNNRNITKFSLNQLGYIEKTFLLLHDKSKNPTGVKSLALTVSQDLLILIDSNHIVYEIDISKEDVVRTSLLAKTTKNFDNESNFVADNGDPYHTVRTIGETNLVFFFQSKSCVDIMNQNYTTIHSIKVEQKTLSHLMQIFTNFVDTYCILFNGNENKVYYIQNLILDTRIKRQERTEDPNISTKQYIGNRLLDIVKRSEIQFGIPISSKETQYYFILSPEYSEYSDRIRNYFQTLDLRAKLQLNYKETDLNNSFINTEELIKAVVSRMPLQLCTIEMGTLIPFSDGKRDSMDHLSSKSFKIEMKVREISFSFLDSILNGIKKNIKVIGVIGRQSTGKSYLMNTIFGTRFSVAAGRCTDGIWMSYAYLEKTHFIVLDCEGLFSDQRTQDEEIQLISFLAAVCDITILSQDLGFSRFQDRLFDVLSQTVNKIGKNNKLFQGTLLVAVRDVSNDSANESTKAAEKKFLDLQNKGKSGFLENCFSNMFQVQLLHHFENKNFDLDIKNIRQIFTGNATKAGNADLSLHCRWENGKELSNRLKILLVQLFTNDFFDSNEIHAQMNLVDLEEEMKRIWTRFDLSDEENVILKDQKIEKKFEDELYLLQLNHTDLILEENSPEINSENISVFILNQLCSIPRFSAKTKGECNELLSLVNELIPDVLINRRHLVKTLMLERFKKKYPQENDTIKERRAKFLSMMEQYMLSFKLQICLKKCASCNLKCVYNAQHTEKIKSELENKKYQLTTLKSSLDTTTLNNITDRTVQLRDNIATEKSTENQLRNQMNLLESEYRFLIEKENLEENIKKYESEQTAEKKTITDLENKIHDICHQLNDLLPADSSLDKLDTVLHCLNEDLKQIIEKPDQHKIDQLNTLIEEFHQHCQTDNPYKNNLLCFSPLQEQMSKTEVISDFQLNTSSLSDMMARNIGNICHYRQSVQQCLEKIKEQINTEQQIIQSSDLQIKDTEQHIIDAEKQKEDIIKLIEITKMDYDKINEKLSATIVEQEKLAKELEEQKQSTETKTSPEIHKIKKYIKDLQHKLKMCSNLSLENNESDDKNSQGDKDFQFFVEEKREKELILAVEEEKNQSLNNDVQVKELQEQIDKDKQMTIDTLEKNHYIQKHPSVNGQQLSQELNEVTQLMKDICLHDENIKASENQLSQQVKRRDAKANYIEGLKQQGETEDIEDEENILRKRNEEVQNIEITLKTLNEKKLSWCNSNALLMKILNDPENDMDQQQEDKRMRLTELTNSSKQLNDNITQLQQSLSYEENRLKELDEAIFNKKQLLDEQKAQHEKYINNIQNSSKSNEVGAKLFQLLSELETLLKTSLEKLTNIVQTRTLIEEYQMLSKKLVGFIDEEKRLDSLRNDLMQQLNTKKNSNFGSQYTTSKECKEKYDTTKKEHECVRSQIETLKQELFLIDAYPNLSKEIELLEKKAQENCDCKTDHKCSKNCQICLERDQSKEKLCILSSGHASTHICDANHICTKLCQLCEIYGFSEKRCVFEFEHSVPVHHQCERIHQCPSTCICSEPCVLPLKIISHGAHQCSKTNCWKPCMFSCGNLCAEQNHFHESVAESVSIAIDDKICTMKKHLCNQSHYCKGLCDAPGVCQIEYKQIRQIWRTESGIEFPYDQIEVEAIRAKCGITIDIGKSSHETKDHVCDDQHTCTERCPDCGSFCRDTFGHPGNHNTIHRNKDEHIFISTNPTERIEIISNIYDSHVRTYNVGESAKPENCNLSCKRRGRSHFHLVQCPGKSECWENKLGYDAKHSNDTYYDGSKNASVYKYDKILCSAYWLINKWCPPVTDAEQKVINLCNTYCQKHVERDENGRILKESVKGFCKLDAWHETDHIFECQKDHMLLEMYRGIDICFVIDTTGSMDIYFERVKETITRIVDQNKELMGKLEKTDCDFRFSIVDYRDHEPEADYLFHTCDFTTDTLAKEYITKLESGSGGDFPEAVLDALEAASTLTWRDNTDRLLFHILDAPPHGKIFTDTTKGERWPDGCPCGRTAANVLSLLEKRNIMYNVLPCSSYLKIMIREFKKYIEVKTLTFDDKIRFDDVIAKQVHQTLVDTEMTLRKRKDP